MRYCKKCKTERPRDQFGSENKYSTYLSCRNNRHRGKGLQKQIQEFLKNLFTAVQVSMQNLILIRQAIPIRNPTPTRNSTSIRNPTPTRNSTPIRNPIPPRIPILPRISIFLQPPIM